MSTTSEYAAPAGPPPGRTFFGQPLGLATLFFTEMWERFSYYGMRALLILFMTAATTGENPGLGLDVGTAAAIYGLYTGLVYLMSLPGGWVADNLWGQRKAVYVGGWIIAAGHFSMAVPSTATFYAGMVLIVLGTGLLKPNVSTVVADLYPESGAARDAGFSIFYMGINLGALIGPLICSFLGEGYSWHWGFSAAGFGMVLGLVQYKRGAHLLGDAGLLKTDDTQAELAAKTRKFFTGFVVVAAAIALFGWLVAQGVIPLTLTQIGTRLTTVILGLVGLYFVYLLTLGGHTRDEKKRLIVILWLFILAAIFWSGFEQAGSSLNLFAQDLTNRNVFGWLMPAGFLQSVNSLFIIIFAPVFASLWIWLSSRNADPSIPLKFAFGLIGLAAGFFVIAWGAANATVATPVSPAWLVVMYFLHTMGELALSPVGLSSITKLAPKRRVGQMMGVWFVATALGTLVAGLVAGSLETLQPFALFRTVAMILAAAGIVALLFSPAVKKLMGEVG
ncbi:MAG TPA: MFS transporter [Gemmatimonadetes bacterium]|nr:MFS transporter [Gemmatimonadota bacterium]